LGWIIALITAVVPSRTFFVLVTLATQTAIDGAVGMFVIYSSILDEDISNFRVALLPLSSSSDTVTAPATPGELPNG